MATTGTFTVEDVASHNSKGNVYMIVHGKVYDLSDYAHKHPGGENLIFDLAGQDATEAFEDVGHSNEALKELRDYLIGEVDRKQIEMKQLPEATVSANENLLTSLLKERQMLLALAIIILLSCLVPGLITPR